MRIALTFDDGPSKWTTPILDVLQKYNAKATFFVCGNQIDGREKILRRIKKRGHEIGNHTMTHPNLQAVGDKQVFEELTDCSHAILELTGGLPHVYRAPYLKDSDTARRVGAALHMTSVGCDVIPGDWADDNINDLAKSVIGDAGDGAIVLLHDGRPSSQPAHDDGGSLDSRAHVITVAERVIPELMVRGYELVTVSDLLFASV